MTNPGIEMARALHRVKEAVGVYQSARQNLIDAAVQYGAAMHRALITDERIGIEISDRVAVLGNDDLDTIFNLIDEETRA